MSKTIKDVLREQDVKPVTNVHGTPLVTYEEQVRISEQDLREGLDLNLPRLNPDGTVAGANYSNAAYNPQKFFDNRYYYDKEAGEMTIITAQTTTGYRAIGDQKTGRIFVKHIPAYVFGIEDGKLAFKRRVMVSDEDFVANYTHKLNQEEMMKLLPLIPTGGPAIPEGKLPF